MSEAAEAPETETGPTTTKPRTLDQIIVSHLQTLQLHHAAVIRTDDVEAIHKMRVTTRRLQASLDLLQIGEKASEIRRIKRRLRKWRRLLSEVRNYDVFLIMVEKETQSRRISRRQEFELLRTTLQERRRRRAKKIKKQLLRINIPALAARLAIALPDLPISDAQESKAAPPANTASDTQTDAVPSNPPVGMSSSTGAPPADTEYENPLTNRLVDVTQVAARTTARLEQRLAEFTTLASQSHPTTDPQELHQLRIAAKRLRYLLEITSSAGFGSAVAALRYLRSLQDRIGDWHDLVALETEIVGIVSRRMFVSAHLADSSHMLRAATHIQGRKEALVSRLFPVRVPRTVGTAPHRLVKSIRRRHRVRRPQPKPGTGDPRAPSLPGK